MSRTSRASPSSFPSMDSTNRRAVSNWLLRGLDLRRDLQFRAPDAQPGLDLFLPAPRDLSLVPIEERQGHAHADSQGVALGVHLLAPVLRAERVVRFGLRQLQPHLRGGPLARPSGAPEGPAGLRYAVFRSSSRPGTADSLLRSPAASNGARTRRSCPIRALSRVAAVRSASSARRTEFAYCRAATRERTSSTSAMSPALTLAALISTIWLKVARFSLAKREVVPGQQHVHESRLNVQRSRFDRVQETQLRHCSFPLAPHPPSAAACLRARLGTPRPRQSRSGRRHCRR